MTNYDLISRSELKKAIHSYENRKLPLDTVIDNLPTVEVETCINYKLCKVRKQCELLKAI